MSVPHLIFGSEDKIINYSPTIRFVVALQVLDRMK